MDWSEGYKQKRNAAHFCLYSESEGSRASRIGATRQLWVWNRRERRRHKLRITRPRTSAGARPLHCASSPNRTRFAGLRFGWGLRPRGIRIAASRRSSQWPETVVHTPHQSLAPLGRGAPIGGGEGPVRWPLSVSLTADSSSQRGEPLQCDAGIAPSQRWLFCQTPPGISAKFCPYLPLLSLHFLILFVIIKDNLFLTRNRI